MFTAKIDRVNKTITVSRNDLIAAGQFGTPEFEQMMQMRTEFPGYTIVEHHIKRNADKQTYGKLTYDVMEGFIESHETDTQKRAAMLKEYETIKKISKTQRAAYRPSTDGSVLSLRTKFVSTAEYNGMTIRRS